MEAQYIIPTVLAIAMAAIAGGYIGRFVGERKRHKKLTDGILPIHKKIPYLKVENGDVSLEEAVNNAPAPKGL